MAPSGRDDGPSVVVVSAHAADFVWRAGGAIARCAEDGAPVTVLCQPTVLLTHAERDPCNLDHALTHEIVLRCRMIAQAAGLPDRNTPPLGASQVMAFEPHQPEQCGFVPNRFLDISPVIERKRAAMKCMDAAQGHLIDYYEDLAVRRGVQAVRNGAPRMVTHAEAFQMVFPTVGSTLW